MSEIKNGRLGLYGAEHLKRDHMMTVGFKGLKAMNARSPLAHRAALLDSGPSCSVIYLHFCVRNCRKS